MAAATVATVGSVGSVCAQCSHIECIAVRQIAFERCRLCRMPIGYDLPFYSEPDSKVHAACVENELIKKLKAGLPHGSVKFLTVEETAELLRVEADTIRNWVSQGRIPFRKAGGKTLFFLEEILEWTKPERRRR